MFRWFRKTPSPSESLPPTIGPDLRHVDSRAKAEAMFRNGKLEKLFLVPLEFGGRETRDNTFFVPLGTAAVKAGIDTNVIRPLILQDKVSQYTANVTYDGASVVPTSVEIVASNPSEFRTTIAIWGSALGDQEPMEPPPMLAQGDP